MKKYSLVFIFISISCFNSFVQAQKPGASAAGTTPTAGAGLLGATQIQQGYHYKIKKRRYFSYMYKKKDSIFFNDKSGKRQHRDTFLIRDTEIHVYDEYENLRVSISQTAGDSALTILIKGGPAKRLAKIYEYEDSVVALISIVATINKGHRKVKDMDKEQDSIYRKLYGIKISTASDKKALISKLLKNNPLYVAVYQLKYVINNLYLAKQTKKQQSDLYTDSGFSLRVKINSLYGLYEPDDRATNHSLDELKTKIQASIAKRDTLVKHALVHSNDSVTSRRMNPLTDSLQDMYIVIRHSYFLRNPMYYIKVPFDMWQFGALTIPFQYRFGYKKSDTVSSNFAANLNVDIYAGWEFGATRFYFDGNRTTSRSYMLLAFAGPTVISLTNSPPNTYPPLPSPATTSKEPSSQLGINTGVGFSFNYKSFNLGFFTGIDAPINSAGKTWYYASVFGNNAPWCRPWVGFGIGFNLPMVTAAPAQSY